MRTFEKTFESLRESVIAPLGGCDVFIHTWGRMGISFDGDGWDLPVDEARVREVYSPKAMVIEPEFEFDDKYPLKKANKQGNKGVLSMFYKIKSAIALKSAAESEGGFKYDCVIKSRPDLTYTGGMSLTEAQDQVNVYSSDLGPPVWVGDLFGFGSSSNMDAYAKTFDLIDDVYELNTCTHPAHIGLHPETLLKLALEKQGVPVLRSTIRVGILRQNGHVDRH